MATHVPITVAQTRAPFIAQLLAPLPADEEQVCSSSFIGHLREDWNRGMDEVRYADAGHAHEAIGLRLKIIGHTEHVSLLMFRNLIEAQAEQCLIPAPTAKELRWKKRLLPSVIERPEVQAAIARDEARLASAEEA